MLLSDSFPRISLSFSVLSQVSMDNLLLRFFLTPWLPILAFWSTPAHDSPFSSSLHHFLPFSVISLLNFYLVLFTQTWFSCLIYFSCHLSSSPYVLVYHVTPSPTPTILCILFSLLFCNLFIIFR